MGNIWQCSGSEPHGAHSWAKDWGARGLTEHCCPGLKGGLLEFQQRLAGVTWEAELYAQSLPTVLSSLAAAMDPGGNFSSLLLTAGAPENATEAVLLFLDFRMARDFLHAEDYGAYERQQEIYEGLPEELRTLVVDQEIEDGAFYNLREQGSGATLYAATAVFVLTDGRWSPGSGYLRFRAEHGEILEGYAPSPELLAAKISVEEPVDLPIARAALLV